MIRIERAIYKDIGHLTNGEIATQEYPLTLDEIKPFCMEKGQDAYLALLSGRAVGYALAVYDKSNDFAELRSIGVLPKFRQVGIGGRLVSKICMEANADGFAKVRAYVPSYAIEDKDDPWNVEQWFWRNEFKAVGTKPGCYRYGHEFDWYIMERQTVRYVREQAAQTVNTPT